MADENKKGITVKIDAALHAQVKEYIESRGMTMAESSRVRIWILIACKAAWCCNKPWCFC